MFLLVLLAIFGLVALLYACLRCKRRRGEKGAAGGAGKSGPLLAGDGKRGGKLGGGAGGLGGALAKERVQPDMDELTAHMEENERAGAEAAGAKDEKVKKQLGKLQYSVDYDFQKGEVRSCVRFGWMRCDSMR